MKGSRKSDRGAPSVAETAGAARTTTRLCAFLLAALVAVHLAYLFEIAGDSVIWPTAMFDLQDRLGMPVAVSNGPVGLLFALVGTLLAIAIWLWASRLAALIFAIGIGWEAYHQGLALWPPILLNEQIPQIAMLSAGLAVFGLLVSLVALFAGFAHHLGRRQSRSEKKQSQRAEAMALRIRARR